MVNIEKYYKKGEPFIDKYYNFDKIPLKFQENFKNNEKDFEFALHISDYKIENSGLLIFAFKDYLYILDDSKEKFLETKFFYSEIDVIKISRELLLGKLIIIKNDQEIVIHFNSSASITIEEFIKYLREKYIDFKEETPSLPKSKIFNNLENIYNIMLSKIDIEIKDFVFQPDEFLYNKEENITTKLTSALYLIGERELIIFNKGKEIKINNERDYEYSETFIPINKIITITESNHLLYDDIVIITINLLKKQIKFLFSNDNKDRNKIIYLAK
ncbi:hypothetical protein EV215_0029 [Hypnocyclicus thermotrophus]|uniref:Uncharacterized protein n=1 Tax=Hypnocyclicus thermotrophus TaxID=1627895 RepID=A0AA46E009_9FUSO|nr:hypothetical protein [Hypnocyclicus thermotrophus]TDT72241.1 hypothetical protein EV215_0029 [Hypnocyclicus thermotrophus]